MIVKKFKAPTEAEAILAAKDELGMSAVVLNVKTLKQRGIFRLFRKDMVEITAALEEKEFVKDEPVRTRSSSFDAIVRDEINEGHGQTAIEEKLDSLHVLLQNQMAKNQKMSRDLEQAIGGEESAQKAKEQSEKDNSNMKFLQLIYNKLIDNEVNEKYANMIIGEVESSLKKESNIDSLLAGVYQKIILKLGTPRTIVPGEDKPKVVFFIGPTGVGKTTTIAKLASKFKLEDKVKVAFVTADTYRIAAVEQLNTYASIIDCPVSVAYDCAGIIDSLEKFSDYNLIMVDTAGRSHNATEHIEEVIETINKVKDMTDKYEVEVYLTLSITAKYRDLVNIVDVYKGIEDYSILFTKLDETCGLGNVLNVRMLTGADLSYTTSGQNVPNDIEVINEQALAKLLLGGND